MFARWARRFLAASTGCVVAVAAVSAAPPERQFVRDSNGKPGNNSAPIKVDVNPMSKVDPKGPIVVKPLPPIVQPKIDPIPPVVVKPLPPVVVKPLPPIVQPKIDPIPPVVVKPLPPVVVKPLPPKVDPMPPMVIKNPNVSLPGTQDRMPKVVPIAKADNDKRFDLVGLNLKNDLKFDPNALSSIRPPIDLKKTKPSEVLGAQPPADFKLKPLALDKINIPGNAVQVDKLALGGVKAGQNFVLNKNVYTKGNYHLLHGTKHAFGWCFPGKHHCHWHHCVWDPCFGCHYYYCPSTCGYYYWSEIHLCYYPCWWFVDHCSCYYPWWLCGGFGGWGYMGSPHVSIIIRW